jgi:hypothetical protein
MYINTQKINFFAKFLACLEMKSNTIKNTALIACPACSDHVIVIPLYVLPYLKTSQIETYLREIVSHNRETGI